MYVLSRIAVVFFGLLLAAALLVMPSSHLKLAAEVLVLVPLTAAAGLFWILAQTVPPAKAPRGTPHEAKWKKDAGLFWGALGIVFFLGGGFVCADQANDEARHYRDMAASDRRQAESTEAMERWNRSQYDTYGYGSHYSSSSYDSSYGDRLIEQLDLATAGQKETLASIGYGYMGLAIVPLIGLILAAKRRTITNAELYPQGYGYGYPNQAWQQGYGQPHYGQPQYGPQGGYAPGPQGGYAPGPQGGYAPSPQGGYAAPGAQAVYVAQTPEGEPLPQPPVG